MKKLLAMLLAAMMVLSLAACGSSTSGESQKPTDTTVNNEQELGETEVTVEEDESIIETVLFDQHGLKVKAMSLNMNGPAGPEIELLITNNAEQEISVDGCEIDINGKLTSASFAMPIGVGKEETMHIAIDQAELDSFGVEIITLIGFTFHITPAGEESSIDIPRVQIPTSATQPEDFEVEIETPEAVDDTTEMENAEDTVVEETTTDETASN